VLEELHISGLGVIEEAALEFTSGLNVLTGETGAGKTMVTVALGLALGARASPGLVRRGSRGLSVETRFRPSPQVLGADEEVTSWAEDGELVLARSVSPEGRSGARISGRLAPVGALSDIGGRLVEIHGQNQAERLASALAQTEFLDRFVGGDHLSILDEYRRAHADLRRAQDELSALERDVREREREKDLLAYQVREIEVAGIAVGERASLAQDEARLAHAERILELVGSAEAAMGGEDGAGDRLALAAGAAGAVQGMDPASEPLAARLASAAAEVADTLEELRRYRDSIDVDPGRLEEVRQRLQAIRTLERKYGDGEEGILAYLEEARSRLSGLQDDEGTRASLRDQVEELTAGQRARGDAIGVARRTSAPQLSESIRTELEDLGMAGAHLDVQLVELAEPGPASAERAEFLFAAGPGQEPMPLAKVASGGELSRTMLACRSVLATLDDIPTLVFDEVDAGIGGRAAVAVGRRLVRLARHRQVVVVTHLAQIAALADRHFVVTKDGGKAAVHAVEGQARERELARMLSGSVGDVSLAHARELLYRQGPETAVTRGSARAEGRPRLGAGSGSAR
jgi:DNA repair protein RecN (Recombination protein N)